MVNRRVGIHDFTFEACSGFTRVTGVRIEPAGTHGSGHVQLMSARTRVQITTAPEPEAGVPGGSGMHKSYPNIFAPIALRGG